MSIFAVLPSLTPIYTFWAAVRLIRLLPKCFLITMKIASMLGVLGGLITLIVGAAVQAGTTVPAYALVTVGSLGLVGIVVGILTLIFAFMADKNKGIWALWLIFSLIGLAVGVGVVIGPLLALIGSLMALMKK